MVISELEGGGFGSVAGRLAAQAPELRPGRSEVLAYAAEAGERTVLSSAPN